VRSIVWSLVRGRASVETKTGSRSFVTEIIVSALGAGNSIFVTRFVGSVKSCLCQLLLLVGAIAKAKATAGMVPCSKMWSIQRLIIVHFALSITPPFEFEDGFCFLCISKNIPQSSPLGLPSFLLRCGYLAAGREVNHSAHAFSTGVLLVGSVEAKI
jgi:hypothetical protein